MAFRVKHLFPRGLYGRAALILLLPIVTIQLLVSIAFIQRHFEGVTRQMTDTVAMQLRLVLDRMGPDGDMGAAGEVAGPLGLRLSSGGAVDAGDRLQFWDFSGRVVIDVLHEHVPGVLGVDLAANRREVQVLATLPGQDATGPRVLLVLDRRRVSASNPHQLLVLMVFAGLALTLIAFVFLRNQLRPITRLAEAAEAFGKGRTLPYRPRGALEVRAAGHAFLDMRARIERQIEQRTLLLSGVSHDLRTPLTRMKLELAMLEPSEEIEALARDVAEMERMLDGFLAFARGDATEAPVPVDPLALVEEVVAKARRSGRGVVTVLPTAPQPEALLRPDAVGRALENLVNNALRHGRQVEVSVMRSEQALVLRVEDDGPGIPPERRDEAQRPFTRLDAARDPNMGGGVGLGLAIAADVARSHGGTLRLGESERLGGLRADLVLAL